MEEAKFTVLPPDAKLDQLIQKAKAENAKLMTYEYETPSKLRSSAEVRTLADNIREYVKSCRRINPKATSSDIELKLKEERPDLYELFETHPRIFKACAHPDTSTREYNRILMMIGMRAQVEQNKIQKKDGDAAVSAFLMEDMKIESKDKATPWSVMDRPG